MAASTVTSKGQITLPKSVRDRLRLETGARVEFVETDSGFLMRAATRDIRELKGVLKRPRRRAVSIEAMNEAIATMGQRKP
jgi:antitoxin PrlF